MKLKRFLCVLLACTVVVGCASVPAKAANEGMVRLEDLGWEQVDMSEVEYWDDSAILTTESVNISVPKHSIYAVNQPLSFKAGDRITINCSYSPSPAGMDFGLLTPEGKFYSVNVKSGSINQMFEISQTGNEALHGDV